MNLPWKHSANHSSVTIESTLFSDGSLLKIDAITDSIIRIHTVNSTGETYNHSFAIETKLSSNASFTVEEVNDKLHLSTQDINIYIDHSLKMDIFDSDNNCLCSDYTDTKSKSNKLSKEELEQLINEGHAVDTDEISCKYTVSKKLFGDEAFYGLGDKTGFLNKKGYDYIMWNSDNPDPHVENPTFRALYKSIPFFMVRRKQATFGYFLDNTYKTYFDLGCNDDDSYSFGVTKGDLDYYFIYGTNMKEVLQNYTYLTGRSPLPQMWTLGYHQSRWSYTSAQEVLSLAHNFRKHNIPCDAIHLDIDYMDNFKVFTHSAERFPDLNKLSEDLATIGIKLVTIIDPGTKAEDGYSLYDEGLQNGYFAQTPDGEVYHNAVWPGDSVFPDFTSTKVRNWWASQVPKLTNEGIQGIWNDMNEPASFNGPLPDDIVFPGDDEPRLHEEVHNIYGHLMAKATYEGLKSHTGKRPFVITRACYSGSQKYTTAWTGDNQSLWSHLKMSIPQLLNLGMSGIPLVGTDIGGFGSNTTDELISRWIEAGCFAPLFRNHSAKMTRRQEPWTFSEQTLDIYRKYVKLHYKFMPYIYDLCYEESLTGLPILRPLIMEYENDDNVINCNDEYMLGSSVLVAPVTDQGCVSRSVYLPEGTWIDYWTGEHISGHQYILQHAAIDVCPIYIKAGSIIPTYPDISYISTATTDKLILEFYPDNNDTDKHYMYTHYQDNGEDFAYQNGEYNLYKFSYDSSNPNGLSVEMLHHGYNPKYKTISTKIC